ncbi:hypothetical protein SAMN05444747_11118 [Variovorax sp. OV329]|nr:hypothetical protein SAMN05444747_11118 [Variovorax sp. OV329]
MVLRTCKDSNANPLVPVAFRLGRGASEKPDPGATMDNSEQMLRRREVFFPYGRTPSFERAPDGRQGKPLECPKAGRDMGIQDCVRHSHLEPTERCIAHHASKDPAQQFAPRCRRRLLDLEDLDSTQERCWDALGRIGRKDPAHVAGIQRQPRQGLVRKLARRPGFQEAVERPQWAVSRIAACLVHFIEKNNRIGTGGQSLGAKRQRLKEHPRRAVGPEGRRSSQRRAALGARHVHLERGHAQALA